MKISALSTCIALCACAHSAPPVDKAQRFEFNGSWVAPTAVQGTQRVHPVSSVRKTGEAIDAWNASRPAAVPSAGVVRDGAGERVAVTGLLLTF